MALFGGAAEALRGFCCGSFFVNDGNKIWLLLETMLLIARKHGRMTIRLAAIIPASFSSTAMVQGVIIVPVQ